MSLISALLLAWHLMLPAAAAGETVDFTFHIQPILAEHCYACHGPDEKQRKARLRLDTREGTFGKTKQGRPIVSPGKPGESDLIARLDSTDPDEVMPPASTHLVLSSREKELIRRWIAEGAEYRGHWAFTPIRRPAAPEVRANAWIRNDIDRFVANRLEKEGLDPSPEADRERLIRRVTFDLTGLPPTLAEVDAFLADPSGNAYERVVQRLLDSPAYGERMATDWLDLARFADTHGYQADRYRPVWPWRDWVIGAFNRDLPYDQFVTWQLAGDLLPRATREQRLATTFNRLHLQNEEGGIVEEEFRVSYIVDRVNTVATAFLGLTTECSRCHDHKYDPVSQRDFYQMFSLFQNIDESGQSVYFGDIMPVPTLLLSNDDQDARLATLRGRIRELEARARRFESSATPAFREWAASGVHAASVPGEVARIGFEELRDNRYANSVDTSKPAIPSDNPRLVPGVVGQALELSGESGVTIPGVGHFTRTDPFSIALWIRPASHAARHVVLHHSRAWMDAGSRGYELLLEDGRPAAALHHMWPGNALKVRALKTLPVQSWSHVVITYDGSSRASGLKLYINGEPAPTETLRDGLWKDIGYSGGEPDLTVGFRFRDSGFKGGAVDDLRVFQRGLTPLEAAHIAGRRDLENALGAPDRASDPRLLEYFIELHHPPARQFQAELGSIRREENQLVSSIPDIMVMQEMPVPKKAYILRRGNYDMPADEVGPGTPAALPPLPEGAPRNRLGFARWLLSEEHPLTARVTVNRAWQLFFGQGLVATADNFGTQGALPSHPELLDWLADTFRQRPNAGATAGDIRLGWSWKELCRLIVTSATYRQASHASPTLLARDPENRLLARGPARRLTAEMIRDQALATSGLLVPKIGGPSVKPYQPEGLWEMAMGGARYNPGKGDDLHRRSLYTFWKRTVPHPAMMVFDAADRSNCSVRRQSTNTPLQPLALLNDTQIVEAARFIGERMLKEGGPSAAAQLTWAFRAIAGRRPTARELDIVTRLFDQQRAEFAREPAAASRHLAVGDTANDPTLDPAATAAAAMVCRALLNHDEALMRR